jgi:hypothetical protein
MVELACVSALSAKKETVGSLSWSLLQLKENFPEAGKQSRDELGKMAGVSGKTYEHGVTILISAHLLTT